MVKSIVPGLKRKQPMSSLYWDRFGSASYSAILVSKARLHILHISRIIPIPEACSAVRGFSDREVLYAEILPQEES